MAGHYSRDTQFSQVAMQLLVLILLVLHIQKVIVSNSFNPTIQLVNVVSSAAAFCVDFGLQPKIKFIIFKWPVSPT